MNKILIGFLTLAIIAGCKQKNKNPENEAIIDNISAPKERNFTDSELIIGRRICNTLANKRELFEKQIDEQQQIKFRGENKNCEGIVYNSADFVVKVSNASSGNLQYVALNRNNYLSEVITDQSGAMKVICGNLKVSDSVSNRVLLGSSIMAINLLISTGYDRFEITKMANDGVGNYTKVSTETINVFSQANQINSKFFGLEQERFRYTTCPGSNKSSYIKQSWVTNVTAF